MFIHHLVLWFLPQSTHVSISPLVSASVSDRAHWLGILNGLRNLRVSRLKIGPVRNMAKSLKRLTNDFQSSGFHPYSPSNSSPTAALRTAWNRNIYSKIDTPVRVPVSIYMAPYATAAVDGSCTEELSGPRGSI